jgi:hypothetical protein
MENAANDSHDIAWNDASGNGVTGLTANQSIRVTAIVKAGTRGFGILSWDPGGGVAYECATFNLSTGAVTQTNAVGGVLELAWSTSLGGGLYAINIIAHHNYTNGHAKFSLATSGTPTMDGFGGTAYAGDGASGAYIYSLETFLSDTVSNTAVPGGSVNETGSASDSFSVAGSIFGISISDTGARIARSG